jgi:hypothetical protein
MTFEEFIAKKDAARAAAPIRVTWRKVSVDTGGGWSGIGPAGPSLLARVTRSDERVWTGYGTVYRYYLWLVRDGRTVPNSTKEIYGGTLAEAKAKAAELLNQEARNG